MSARRRRGLAAARAVLHREVAAAAAPLFSLWEQIPEESRALAREDYRRACGLIFGDTDSGVLLWLAAVGRTSREAEAAGDHLSYPELLEETRRRLQGGGS